MWRFSEAELNWVRTKMRRMSACRQPLIGTSMSRYLPPIGTAGFERKAVNGNSRDPCPPPRMMASVSVLMPERCSVAWGKADLKVGLYQTRPRVVEGLVQSGEVQKFVRECGDRA